MSSLWGVRARVSVEGKSLAFERIKGRFLAYLFPFLGFVKKNSAPLIISNLFSNFLSQNAIERVDKATKRVVVPAIICEMAPDLTTEIKPKFVSMLTPLFATSYEW